MVNKRLAIIGGGAAGFFLAANVKRMAADLDVTIFEKRNRVLAKVAVSGGGRCNLTNTFAHITDLRQAYPRGAMLLKRLFRRFGPEDTVRWFETRGVRLVAQDDDCIFPAAQDSQAIIGCLVHECRRFGVQIRLGEAIDNPASLLSSDAHGGPFDYVAVTIGGTPHGDDCVPSLFTFNIKDDALHNLMGTVVEGAIASIPGTKFRADGALLITHWGMSGPAILRLSSYAARHLAECDYRAPLLVNWTGETNAELVREELLTLLRQNAKKDITNLRPFALPSRLWEYIVAKAIQRPVPADFLGGPKCADIGKKTVNRLVELLTADPYTISSRCHHKDEFVTCGGIPLDTIDKGTLQSLSTPGLYYAGEVLDIDGITGGFNLQAAWTTAYTVAEAIASLPLKNSKT